MTKIGRPYMDTSALAKWYIPERRSLEVRDYAIGAGPLAISWLTVLEMKSLLARRRRAKQLDAEIEARVFATLSDHVRLGYLERHDLNSGTFEAALNIMSMLPSIPLRTLDALHLAVAMEFSASEFVTADGVLLAAADSLGLRVVDFT